MAAAQANSGFRSCAQQRRSCQLRATLWSCLATGEPCTSGNAVGVFKQNEGGIDTLRSYHEMWRHISVHGTGCCAVARLNRAGGGRKRFAGLASIRSVELGDVSATTTCSRRAKGSLRNWNGCAREGRLASLHVKADCGSCRSVNGIPSGYCRGIYFSCITARKERLLP